MSKSKGWRRIPRHKTPKWVKRYIPRCKAGVTNEEDMNTLYVKGRYYTYKIVAVVNDEEGGIGARVYRRKRSKKTKIRKPIKKEKKPSYASWSQLFVLFIIFHTKSLYTAGILCLKWSGHLKSAMCAVLLKM